MKEYLTRKNIGLALTILIAIPLVMSAGAKIFGTPESQMESIKDWMVIIGIGEITSLILFMIPKTMRLGTVLLSAYFGGAIMFHMSHPNPEHQAFFGAAAFLFMVWIISWIRGLELIDL